MSSGGVVGEARTNLESVITDVPLWTSQSESTQVTLSFNVDFSIDFTKM